jgi:hypothetical protein
MVREITVIQCADRALRAGHKYYYYCRWVILPTKVSPSLIVINFMKNAYIEELIER